MLNKWIATQCKFAQIPDQEWSENQYRTNPSSSGATTEYLKENMSKLVPAVINHLEAAKLVLETHGLKQYHGQIDEIIREVQTIERTLQPQDTPMANYDMQQENELHKIQEEKGLKPVNKVTTIPPRAQVAFRSAFIKTEALRRKLEFHGTCPLPFWTARQAMLGHR